jgi:hypothetical protein
MVSGAERCIRVSGGAGGIERGGELVKGGEETLGFGQGSSFEG